MSCTKWESDIALYAGDDLPPGRVAPMEVHLAQCADCRALEEELRAGRRMLAELSDDEEALVAQVHRRVLARIEAPRPARLYWKLALAATLILAVFLAWPRHPPAKAVLVAGGAAPRAGRPLGPASHAAQAVAPLARKRRHHLRRAPDAQPAPPLLVQFVTDDPNIVIYWLVDQKPQGD